MITTPSLNPTHQLALAKLMSSPSIEASIKEREQLEMAIASLPSDPRFEYVIALGHVYRFAVKT